MSATKTFAFVVLALILLAAYYAVLPSLQHVDMLASTHAVMNHGQAAINAQNCFNGAGQIMKQNFIEPQTGRHMSFCNQSGNWFVSIDGPDGGNVTMFPRSMAKCLRDVLDYAIRSGFLPPP
jgi:hypothetical protein